jgi:hypothetical protein
MGLLLGVGGIMQELRRVRSGIQSEQVRKKPRILQNSITNFFLGRHGNNA